MKTLTAKEYLAKEGYKDGMIWTLENVEKVCNQYAQHYCSSKLAKEDVYKRKVKFADKALKTNYNNNILNSSEILSTNGTSFIEYWTEKGENDRKMRFEKQTSFDIKRRLLTWKNNNFNNAKPTYTDKIKEYLNR